MSSRVPTSVRVSLGILAHRPRAGWGVALHDGRDARVFRASEPAGNSPWLPFLEQRPLRGRVVLAHVRRAMGSGIALRSTQPFQRELGGRALYRAWAVFPDAVPGVPLTDENWRPLAQGSLTVVQGGDLVPVSCVHEP